MSETNPTETEAARRSGACNWEACNEHGEPFKLEVPGGCVVLGILCADHAEIQRSLLD
jgi:hypothetical protein